MRMAFVKSLFEDPRISGPESFAFSARSFKGFEQETGSFNLAPSKDLESKLQSCSSKLEPVTLQLNPGFFGFCPARIAYHAYLSLIETIRGKAPCSVNLFTCELECIPNFKFIEAHSALK